MVFWNYDKWGMECRVIISWNCVFGTCSKPHPDPAWFPPTTPQNMQHHSISRLVLTTSWSDEASRVHHIPRNMRTSENLETTENLKRWDFFLKHLQKKPLKSSIKSLIIFFPSNLKDWNGTPPIPSPHGRREMGNPPSIQDLAALDVRLSSAERPSGLLMTLLQAWMAWMA